MSSPEIVRGSYNPITGREYEMPPTIPWEEWYVDQERGPHRWNDDEHYTLIGTTGCGKSTLARNLLELRQYVMVVATKPRDDSLDRFIKDPRYRFMHRWEDLPVEGRKAAPKRILWPRIQDLNYDQAWQQYYINEALDKMFTQGGWNIYLDEVRYLADELKLRRKLNLYLLQYRALGGSLIAGTQRPAWIPREFYSQSQHICLWHQTDDYDLKRISGIGALDTSFIRRLLPRLGRHQFLYLHVPTGYNCISEAPNPNGGR